MKKSINKKEQCVQTDVMQSVLKESDLRIGNKIFFIICDREDSKLDEKKEITVGISDFEFIRDNNSLFEGIPLTEEWLLKFGFELKYGCFLLSTNRGTILIEEDLAQISSVISHDGFMSPCKYVHQLQNLYFALTGSELTVA